ncbi:TIGR01777 family oxidoreductase [Paenibacillus sp. MMS18-CY102]|uniref:TIGR01777 family oxidoreductase n=1 Tax=Paenibacillus sp. MMS18-CY102 TaxID=2682849 RepID=UPI001365F7BA|nr:TIGR01777 family protein [Paenibacillus sp. MMS18-CY102]
MTKKVVLAGGTGFIGQYLERKYQELGYETLIISRQPQHLAWQDTNRIKEALESAELLINLAGKSVNCRYNDANKEAILRSRTETTAILGQALAGCTNPPPLWLNSSTATIYRDATDRPMTEATGDIGTGFSVEVAQTWERALFAFELPRTRQIALRISIVLGADGGAMTPYRNLVRYGLGGQQGSGDQRFSWIHIEDLFRIMQFLQQHEELSGVFNCSSPNPVTNRIFMREMRRAMNRRIGLPAAAWMLAVGAFALRTETELITKSRWVMPERLLHEGFVFQFADLDAALADLLKH